MSTQIADEEARAKAAAEWWRTVLGQYPTGVVLITALDEDGTRLGMVVGSFAAVSKDPPLVTFMPARESSTYPLIAARGRFAVSVLGSAHEELCRAFSRKTPNRWDDAEWVPTRNGLPRLADAVSWFECRIQATHEAGDHALVIGEVDEFGAGAPGAGLPLIYFRGGYGSFTVSSLDYDVRGLSRQLKQVDAIRGEVRAFADRWDAECVVYGRAADTVVVLHAANLGDDTGPASRPVGATFPFAAPLAAAFAAWGEPDTSKTWTENARQLLGGIDRGVIEELLRSTRDRGFGVWHRATTLDSFRRISTDGPSDPDDTAQFWRAVAGELEAVDRGLPLRGTSTLQIPIRGADGRAELVMSISHIDRLIGAADDAQVEATVRELEARLTSLASAAEG